MKNVVAVIMGGGKGTRLFPLTRHRAKPAVPVAGRARLIDLALSNCINSGLTRIFVLTQFNSASLNRHVNRTYNFGTLLPGGVEVISAELTPERQDWFQGTADAVRQNLHHLLDRRALRVLILAGDHLYQMDYGPFLRRHEESGADITISVCPVSGDNASSFGLLHCDEHGFVTRFAEKPTGETLESMRIDPAAPLAGDEPAGAPFLASMGIYVFTPSVLTELLSSYPEQNDFGRDLIPQALRAYRVAVHCFRGYWEDIGTISSFYRANLALTRSGQYSLYNPDFPLYTRPRYLSPTRLGRADIERALIAEGSVFGPCTVRDSVVGIRSRIEDGVTLEGTLVMGNDHYETEAERAASRGRGIPPLGIGVGSVVRRAILDKGVRVGRGVRIVNERGLEHWDDDMYYVRDGIVIIPKDGVVPDGTVI
ncbi:MAG TPA: glucose-1-phosphate adenylyltransferase [Thermoanaerobaculia bacterium]|nr:glucose-1-phosphate adenylyltransferase [Thermoanaerobaculia bacterium]